MFKAAETRRFVTRRGRPLSFSLLGFGSAPLGNFPEPLTEDACDATVTRAWDSTTSVRSSTTPVSRSVRLRAPSRAGVSGTNLR